MWLCLALPSVGVQPWHDDITLLVMEDVCAGYKQPCIIDIKASGHVPMCGTLRARGKALSSPQRTTLLA